jgi:hypothetical protein
MHGRTMAALSLTVAMLVLTGALLVPPAAAPLSPRALVSGLAAIPARYLAWYAAAARTCPGLDWEVLAGIGTMESDNGRSHARGVYHGRNRKGAEGPMQFEPATFAEYAVRADRSARLTPYDPADAIFTAARMLCADGAAGGSTRGLRGAIFAYNHAHWYVRDVLALAAGYAAEARHASGGLVSQEVAPGPVAHGDFGPLRGIQGASPDRAEARNPDRHYRPRSPTGGRQVHADHVREAQDLRAGHIRHPAAGITQRKLGEPRRHLARVDRLDRESGRDRYHRQGRQPPGAVADQLVELGRPQGRPGQPGIGDHAFGRELGLVIPARETVDADDRDVDQVR